MIKSLDHIVIVCADMDAAIADYSLLMGRQPDWRAQDAKAGSATALFCVDNVSLELLAPSGAGPMADRLRALLAIGRGGLLSLVFACNDIDGAKAQLERRALGCSDPAEGASTDSSTGRRRRWRTIRIDDAMTFGVRQFVLENADENRLLAAPCVGGGQVCRLDHVVINSPNPDRAVAHYGARLGLDFALDRMHVELDTRFQFFRVGDAVIEIVSRLTQVEDRDANDALHGVTWAVQDISAAHARLQQAGVAVSSVRPGRKAGTRVFSALDHTCGVPTLFLQENCR